MRDTNISTLNKGEKFPEYYTYRQTCNEDRRVQQQTRYSNENKHEVNSVRVNNANENHINRLIVLRRPECAQQVSFIRARNPIQLKDTLYLSLRHTMVKTWVGKIKLGVVFDKNKQVSLFWKTHDCVRQNMCHDSFNFICYKPLHLRCRFEGNKIAVL